MVVNGNESIQVDSPLVDYVIIDKALKKDLGGKRLDYGTITIKVKDGKSTLITVEKTIKLD